MRGDTIKTGRVLLLSAAMLAATACNGWAKVIYVDDDANGLGNGASWQTAYKYLQDALADATAAEKPVEIRVAQGVYRPDRSVANPEGSRDRKATFQMLSGVTLVGGFAGLEAPDPNARDVGEHETIISGDLAGNDVLTEDPEDSVFAPEDGVWPYKKQWCLVHEFTRRENSVHVVTSSGVDQTAVLDGFTITAGNAFDPPYWMIDVISFDDNDRGGGMFNRAGSPTVKNCTFVANSALGEGGALCNKGLCNLVLSDCRFADCSTLMGRGGAVCNGDVFGKELSVRVEMTRCVFENNAAENGHGGAMVSFYANVILTDCRFARNSRRSLFSATEYMRTGSVVVDHCEFSENLGVATNFSTGGEVTVLNSLFRNNGGGVYSGQCHVTAGNCAFLGNSGNLTGGAVCCYSGNLTLANCLFIGNQAKLRGGAVSHGDGSLIMRNCTLSGNLAGREGGAASLSVSTSSCVVTNCILWDNEAPKGSTMSLVQSPQSSDPSTIEVSYSLVQGGQDAFSLSGNCNIAWGAGNTDVDPCFVDPGYWDANDTPDALTDDIWVNGDYHLKSRAGHWDLNSEGWVTDSVTSPCIDTGDPNSPIGYEPFPNGGWINMGAYGGTSEASKSFFGGPVCETVIAGDINGDCRVDFADLTILAEHWLEKAFIDPTLP